jgi:hypothetical protein
MATPTIQSGRLITKRSAIPGTVPTVPAVDDINTFIATDIFKGELFYNIPDNLLYTRDNTGIVTLSGGGGPTYVYYTEVTTPGSESAQIDVVEGIYNGSFSVIADNNTTASWTDSTNIYQMSLNGSGSSLGATDGTNNNGFTANTSFAQMSALDGTSSGEVIVTTTQSEIVSTDGTNFVQLRTNISGESYWEATDGTVSSSTFNISGNGNADLVGTDGSSINRLQFFTTAGIPNIALSSTLGTTTAAVSCHDNGLLRLRSSNSSLPSSMTIELRPTTLQIAGLAAYADDTDAGTGGLLAGMMYQTDGTGSAPLNVAGIVMIKQ